MPKKWKEFLQEEEYQFDKSIYTDEGRALLVDDDEIAPWEAGFVRGATDPSFSPFEDSDLEEIF
ncbi:hypothetical protein HOI26_03100 [Candidatus Woesearchaeota archaeon]|jgi:hypothetical protein|nr:hypothetical protein [Candidatus Woesearchaeota archaeon]MBT5740066.1 hypothetical protein [Candidatus Woesearchaeota archaeon]